MTTQPLKLIALALVLLLASDARAQGDLDLLTTTVPPNVMILFDNSGSMNHHLWDDDFDPALTYASWCGLASGPTSSVTYSISPGGPTWNLTLCGVTRTLYHDTTTSQNTRYDANYLNWLYGVATAAELADEPQQTRLQAAKESITAVIDSVNPDDVSEPLGYQERVRFGLANFRGGGSPDGGFVSAPIASGNKSAVKSDINATVGDTWTPLSETLVDLGRYFAGSNLLDSYPRYNKNTANGDATASPPASPIDVFCRKNFVLIVTDGEPTQDQNNHHGAAFLNTIGNMDGDSSECSAIGTACTDAPGTGRDDGITYSSNGTDWLDDVAFYLNNKDLDPTLDGMQNIITYTVGFTIDHPLLQETAYNGSGSYFTTSSSAILALQLGAALQDIIERSSSFSATTVPTGRTAFGDGFYTAHFEPSSTDGFWPGHLQAYRLSPDLVVLDKNGNPALDPISHQFREPRAPFWDAQTELSKPTHPPRNLYTTQSGARTAFDTGTIDATELDVQASELTLYPGFPVISFANTEALADGLVRYLEGQDTFDKDVDGDTSELREFVLGDIFQSDRDRSALALPEPGRGFRTAA
jgi:type IV pilus assembly protein PilY1